MAQCPVCQNETNIQKVEDTDSGAMLSCPQCGLQFACPVPSGCPLFVDFSAAGRELYSGLDEGKPLDPILTPSERMALKWLRRSAPRGAVVLELCFEVGRFLEGARRAGYKPIGADPVEGHVDLLRERGFTVFKGHMEALAGTPEPATIVILESLVRFPDPVGFLTSVRRRFPQAALFVSVPSPNRSLKAPGFDRRTDYPPHHITRWTRTSLKLALDRAGYRSRMATVYIDANSLEVPAPVRVAVRLAFRFIGEGDYSIVGLGVPARA